jgi:dihydrofolate reductase
MAGTMTINPQGPKPRISIIVAMAKNRVIGANNKLPWHLSADLKRFKALTMGHHIVMGRKTFESIGRILPGRTTVVVTRNPDFHADGAIVVNDIDAALAKCIGDREAFFIGGKSIFQSALPFAERIYLTEIDKQFEGDVHFPAIEMHDWRLIEREIGRDEMQGLDYVFNIWERVAL